MTGHRAVEVGVEVATVEAAMEDTTAAGAAMAVVEGGEIAHTHGRGRWVSPNMPLAQNCAVPL